MLILRKPWDSQPIGGAEPASNLGLTALILPGQSSFDLVSGINLSSIIGTPTGVVGNQGPALQHNANREAIYTSATGAQKSPQGSIVWAGTLTGTPTVAACLGGTTFDASNTAPYVGIEIKRRTTSANVINVSYSYGASVGSVETLSTSGVYTTGDIVAVGVFADGRQHIVVRSATGIEVASGTRAGTLNYGSTARIEVGESLNSRNPAADSALLALSSQAWSLELATQVANDVWGMLFAPRSIWVPVSAGGGGTTDAAITAAAGTSTTSTLTGASTAATTPTAAAGAATASTVAASSTAATAITSATGAATASTLTGSAVVAGAITAAAGVATGETLVGDTLAAGSASITPAVGVSTAATITGFSTAASSFVLGEGSASAAVMVGSDGAAPITVLSLGGGGWLPKLKRRTKKELDDERRRLGILPPEVVAEVAAAPVERRRITLQDLIGKKAEAQITNVDLSEAVAASKKRKRQRDDELLLLM